jgi:hypothetical protein
VGDGIVTAAILVPRRRGEDRTAAPWRGVSAAGVPWRGADASAPLRRGVHLSDQSQ